MAQKNDLYNYLVNIRVFNQHCIVSPGLQAEQICAVYWCLSKLLIFNVTPRRPSYLSERTQPESVLVRPQSGSRFQQRKGQPGCTAKCTCLCQKTRNTGDVWLPGRSTDPTPKSVLHQHFKLSRSSQLPTAASFPKRAELCPERAGLLFSLPVLPGRSFGNPPIR